MGRKIPHFRWLKALLLNATALFDVDWSPYGKYLVSGGGDGTLRWWDMHRSECLWVRQAHQGTVQSLRRSPDSTQLASCGDDGAIMVWDLHSGEHLKTLRRDRPYERLNITGIRGLSEAQKEALRALGRSKRREMASFSLMIDLLLSCPIPLPDLAG